MVSSQIYFHDFLVSFSSVCLSVCLSGCLTFCLYVDRPSGCCMLVGKSCKQASNAGNTFCSPLQLVLHIALILVRNRRRAPQKVGANIIYNLNNVASTLRRARASPRDLHIMTVRLTTHPQATFKNHRRHCCYDGPDGCHRRYSQRQRRRTQDNATGQRRSSVGGWRPERERLKERKKAQSVAENLHFQSIQLH